MILVYPVLLFYGLSDMLFVEIRYLVFERTPSICPDGIVCHIFKLSFIIAIAYMTRFLIRVSGCKFEILILRGILPFVILMYAMNFLALLIWVITTCIY